MANPQSPTSTEKWLRCPTLWKLDRQWTTQGEWRPHMALGAAIGKGLEVMVGPEPDTALNEALTLLEARFEPNDTWTLDGLTGLVTKALKTVKETTFAEILEHETIVGAEVELDNGRIDLLTKRGDDFIVTDHKVRLQLKPEYVQKELIASETDWQLWDYAWRTRQTYQTGNIIIRRHMIILSPRMKAWLHPTRLNAEVLDRWSIGADQVWHDMEKAKELVASPNYGDYGVSLPMNLRECNGRFGKCEFYIACHTCNQDPKLMAALYNPKQ